MSTGKSGWETIKADYLREVKRALAHVKKSAARQVLEDVAEHLNRRYEELSPEKRNGEAFYQIIEDMGPARDYAELLSVDLPKAGVGQNLSPWVPVLIAVMVIAGIFSVVPLTKDYLDAKGMDSASLSHKAWQLWLKGDHRDTERFFALSLKKDSSNQSAWNGLGWSEFHLGKFDRARVSFERCLKINANFSGAHNGLGYILK